jgi:carbamoyltransferase
MVILGLNAFHGDSSAAVFRDGVLTGAVEEERFNRIKHWAGLPVAAAHWCLAGSVPDHVAISRDPKAHALKKLARVASRPQDWRKFVTRAQNSAAVLQVGETLRAAGVTGEETRVHFVEHHRAHLASAFLCSPYEEAAVVSVDGFGDFSSVMWGVGRGTQITVKGGTHYPHSLGLFYTAITQLTGFPKYGDEYKMMGLAAFGEPRYLEAMRRIVRLEGDEVRLDLSYFTHHTKGVDMTWEGGEPALGPVYSERLTEEFGAARVARSEITQRERDLAASAQAVLEEVYFGLLRKVQAETGLRRVCLAGGVALNCAANGKLFAKTPFTEVYVQPAAHDAGTSIGAALWVQHCELGIERGFEMRHVYTGSRYTEVAVQEVLDREGVRYWPTATEEELVTMTAEAIAAGKIVGWFQGKMEFGPRALGARSILADPRRGDMKEVLNRRIKYREPFRPFCPSVLAEACGEWFTVEQPSPFMVMAYPVREEKRALVPAIVHADGTGRLQTVAAEDSPLYWRLIRRFGEMTGVPMVLNTSFNENEPIVRTPEEALDCFLRTQMDVLVMGPFVVRKEENAGVRGRKAVWEGAGGESG